MTTIDLPEWPWRTVRRLAHRRGVRVWVVGGAVRDVLLGRPVHDWDFAVDREALELARAVGDALGGAYFPLDAERGTGRVLLPPDRDGPLEFDFALLRGGSLEADLTARDFTINAMAADEDGALIDPLGGQADLEAGRIQATSGSAFRDDPLRLMRAVRLEAELGFEIDPETADWIRRDAPLLTEPSAERVRDELVRGLPLPGAGDFVQRLDGLGLLPRVIPELGALKGVAQSPPHRFDAWRHTLTVMDMVENVIATVMGDADRVQSSVPPGAWGELARVTRQFAEDLREHLSVEVCSGRDRALLLKLAALLHDLGKPDTRSVDEEGRAHFYGHEPVGAEIAAARLRKLHFSHEEVTWVRILVESHLRPPHLARTDEITRRAIYRYFRETGDAGVDVVLLSLADHLATWGPNLRERRWARRLEMAELLLHHCFERHEETVDPAPLIGGHDLMSELGLEPGPEIGRLLEAVREAQAAGEVRTREEALALAREMSPVE